MIMVTSKLIDVHVVEGLLVIFNFILSAVDVLKTIVDRLLKQGRS